MKTLIPLAVVLFAILQVKGYEMLDGIPITFSLDGNVSYTPTSGGVNIPGYKLKIGFSKYKWIGLMFMDVTSESTYDVLIVKRSDAPTGGYYEAEVGEYFVSTGRPNKLISDSVNNMDKEVTGQSASDYFEVEIYRTKGNTQGEDWQGGQFVRICFVTYSGSFSQDRWYGYSSSCYGYDVSVDYHSIFRGPYIATMGVDGSSAPTYGGIQGPVLRLELFWYISASSLSSNDVYIRIGDEFQEERLGFDYHKCGQGDYFGKNTGSLTPDTLWSGYDDGECTIVSTSEMTKIAYSRTVHTGDEFDAQIYEKTNICIIVGSRSSCKELELSNLYPIMTVESAFIIFEQRTQILLTLLCAVMLLIFHN